MNMEMVTQEKGDILILSLKGELTIYHAGMVVEKLNEVMMMHEKIAIDLGSVTELDTAGVQVLILAKKDGQRNGKSVRYVNHSEVVVRVIDLLGLVGLFGDKIRIPTEDRGKYTFRYGMEKESFAL